MTVFVVFYISHGREGVLAICDTRRLAESLVKTLVDGKEPANFRIDEWPLKLDTA